MGNHTVKKKAAGLNDKTVIVGMQINCQDGLIII